MSSRLDRRSVLLSLPPGLAASQVSIDIPEDEEDRVESSSSTDSANLVLPDHHEVKLRLKTVVIVGGTTLIGSGLVQSFSQRGARVIVPGTKKHELPSDPQIYALSTDTKSPDKLRKAVLSTWGPPDHVFVVSDPPEATPTVTTHSLEALQAGLDSVLVTNFNAAKAFAPIMADDPSASYTIVSSSPRMGLHAVCMSGLYGLAGALRAEFDQKQLRVNEVRIGLYVLKSATSVQSHAVSTETLGDILSLIPSASSFKGNILTANNRGELSRLAAQLVLASPKNLE